MTKRNSDEQKFMPYLWFDNQAEEAANFYTSIFGDAKVGDVTRYDAASAEVSGIPEGSAMTVAFQIEGQQFVGLNGGPMFNFTPAVSFFVSCETEAEIDALWGELSAGGQVLMPLDNYPFTEKFGWLNDKFGVSWQLNLASSPQKITPFLMFVGEQHGKAEEAMDLYTSLFDDSDIMALERYGEADEERGEIEGTVQHARFSLDGHTFMAMDSNLQHDFTFTPAISFLVDCETQEEVDAYWESLTEGGEEQPCGWLKDKYGVSWQIIPGVLGQMLQDEDPARAQRVTEAMLQMSKIDIATLQQAYEGA